MLDKALQFYRHLCGKYRPVLSGEWLILQSRVEPPGMLGNIFT